MKQQMKVNKAKRHLVRVTEASYQIVHKLAKIRDLSDTAALDQIIQDYFILATKQNIG